MRHSGAVRVALVFVTLACVFSCSDNGHGPVIGAPSGPVVVSEGGSLPGAGGNGADNSRGGTSAAGDVSLNIGGELSSAAGANGGTNAGTGIAGAAFGTGGGLSTVAGGPSF